MDYQLVGIICHLGKNMEHGHYVYYHKVGEKRWALFNDNVVE
jgi:ubiquitin C-terminal hydrolase